jgi:hypothetical protein
MGSAVFDSLRALTGLDRLYIGFTPDSLYKV